MLKEIRCFCEVVHQQSLAAAARHMNISAPMMTRHIQRLEQTLGSTLLHRTTRGMCLTDAGQLFYDRALDIITSYEAGARAVQTNAEIIAGHVKIGLPASIAALWVIPKLSEFHAMYPDIEIEIVQGNHLLDMVYRGFDCIVHCGSMPDSSFYYKPIRQWKKYTCVSPGYVKNHTIPTNPQMLNQHACLVHIDNHNNSWKYLKNGQLSNTHIQGPFKVDSSQLIAHMAANGLGICYLPDFTVHQYIQSGELTTILDAYMPKPLGMYIIYPNRQYQSKKLKVVMEFLIDILQIEAN